MKKMAIPIGFLMTTLVAIKRNSIGVHATNVNDAIASFRTFSSTLAPNSDLDEFSQNKGAAMSFPFGVGYMLANINDQVWNVSNGGFQNVMKSPTDKIASHYTLLNEKLNEKGIHTHNTLFIRDENSTVTFPEDFKNFKPEIIYTDFISDWKPSWYAMNGMIANHTNGKLDDQFMSKGGWYGGPFQTFSVSAYVNANHMKLNFEKSLQSVGTRPFWDGRTVEFFEADGKFPFIDRDNYSAVAIPMSGKRNYVVFALPKGELKDFLEVDLTDLLENADPATWIINEKKIQVPALNLTLLNQYFKHLHLLGINRTFCWYEVEDEAEREPFFAGPIAQANYIHISSEYLEVASATGSSVNSVEELREDWNIDDSSSANISYLLQASTVTKDANTKATILPVKLDDHPMTMTTMATETVDQPTLQFDKPFFWYIYDGELGPIYYGSVHSLATYKKEKDDLEMDEDFSWLMDFYKSYLWNCPWK